MAPDPERALDRLDDALLAERYGPTVPDYTQRDIDIANLAAANSAAYEDTLLRRRGRAGGSSLGRDGLSGLGSSG